MAIVINGKELEGDFYDADFMDRYESAMIRMKDRAEAGKNQHYKKVGDAMRAQIQVVRECVDEIFGHGTADDIFGPDNHNLKDHLQAIADLADCARQYRKDQNDFLNRYTQRNTVPYRPDWKRKK